MYSIINITATPASTLNAAYKNAAPICPVLIRSEVSRANVENVVKSLVAAFSANIDLTVQKAKAIVKAKKSSAVKYLNKEFLGIEPSSSATFYCCFK